MTGAARIVDGKYRVGPLVGRGAMGAVYAAQHVLTRVEVALKLVPPNVALTPQGQERFKREVAIAALVGHPGIVRVLDAGVDPADQTHYVAMERLAGEDLAARALADDFTVSDGVTAVRAALDPLAAAHAHGVVHRDLKPENIFLHTPPGGPLGVKLLDFGIARDRQFTNTVTAEDVALGTPNFMSPEQAMNARSVTPASDVWSVGVMLYWLLAGRLPFERENAFKTLEAVCSEAPPTIDEVGGPATRELVALTMRCLDKDPLRRPPNAAALAIELDEVLGHFETATSRESAGYRPAPAAFASPPRLETEPTPLLLPPPPAPAPRRAPLVVAVVSGLVAITGLAAWWSFDRPSTEVQALESPARTLAPPPEPPAPVVDPEPEPEPEEDEVALVEPPKRKAPARRRSAKRPRSARTKAAQAEPARVVAAPPVEPASAPDLLEAPPTEPRERDAPVDVAPPPDAGPEVTRVAEAAPRIDAGPERPAVPDASAAPRPRDAGPPAPVLPPPPPPPPPPTADENPFVTF